MMSGELGEKIDRGDIDFVWKDGGIEVPRIAIIRDSVFYKILEREIIKVYYIISFPIKNAEEVYGLRFSEKFETLDNCLASIKDASSVMKIFLDKSQDALIRKTSRKSNRNQLMLLGEVRSCEY